MRSAVSIQGLRIDWSDLNTRRVATATLGSASMLSVRDAAMNAALTCQRCPQVQINDCFTVEQSALTVNFFNSSMRQGFISRKPTCTHAMLITIVAAFCMKVLLRERWVCYCSVPGRIAPSTGKVTRSSRFDLRRQD